MENAAPPPGGGGGGPAGSMPSVQIYAKKNPSFRRDLS